jgi:hypothetical protein
MRECSRGARKKDTRKKGFGKREAAGKEMSKKERPWERALWSF